MAHLTKDDYLRREASAARRAMNNEAIGQANGLSEEQTDALDELCAFRHKMHTSAAEELAYGEERAWTDELSSEGETPLRNRIKELFGEYPFAPIRLADDVNDYLLDDLADECRDSGDFVPEDCGYDEDEDNMSEAWHTFCHAKQAANIERINAEIEAFLRGIDEQYGTSYCPTGKQRMY